MPSRAPYFELIREMKNAYNHRLRLVVHARQHGIKATARLFRQFPANTKELSDIPRYWPKAQHLRLPLVQYTAREVRSGLLLLAFASRRSASASAVFAQRIQRHLDRCGVELRHLVWQTDNGSEFVGARQPDASRSGFPAALGDREHLRIPPAAHTYQSDVKNRSPPHRRRILRPGIVLQSA